MGQLFEQVHADYISAWNQGWATGDASAIVSFIDLEYFGTFCSSGMDAPEVLNYQSVCDGIQGALSGIPNGRQTCEAMIIKRHGDNEVVVSYLKKILIPQDQSHASAVQLEVWRKSSMGWKLLREYVEV